MQCFCKQGIPFLIRLFGSVFLFPFSKKMAIYDFITSLRVRANKRGLTYTTRLYTGNKPDHRRVLIPH